MQCVIQQDIQNASDEFKKYFQAYVDGINEYIESKIYSKPVEMTLLRIDLEKVC